MLNRLVLTAVLLAPAVAGAQSSPAKDATSGLAVVPPAGYDVQPMKPSGSQAARFAVKLPTDTDTGCQVAFTPAPQNKKFTQAQLDQTMRGPQWQEAARKALSAGYDLTEAKVVDGRNGPLFTAVGDFKDRPGLPERAKNVQTMFVVRETPRGRTSTVCVGDRATFGQRRGEFAAVAEGTAAP